VADHDVPVVAHRHVAGLDALGDCADLVDLEQQRVAHLLLQRHVDALDVGDQQVVTHNLAGVRDDFGQFGLGFEVVLVEWVLDGDHVLVLGQVDLHVDQLLARQHVGPGLEAEVLGHLAVLLHHELARSHVGSDRELAGHLGLLERLEDDLDRLVRVVDVGREAALVADVDGGLALLGLDQALEHLEHFRGRHHRVLEAVVLHRHHHELLEGQFVARVRAAVDDVQTWDRHAERRRAALLRLCVVLLDALLERLALEVRLELEQVHAHRQDRVGAQLALVEAPLVRRAVQRLDHVHVYVLRRRVHVRAQSLLDLVRHDLVHVVHRLRCALDLAGRLVAQFHRFIDTRRRAARHGRHELTVLLVQL